MQPRRSLRCSQLRARRPPPARRCRKPRGAGLRKGLARALRLLQARNSRTLWAVQRQGRGWRGALARQHLPAQVLRGGRAGPQ